MEVPAAVKAVRINRLLPYWAVFQADMRQTLRSWVYRIWVLVSVLVALGYLLYKGGVSREAGIVQLASNLMAELLRWTVLGSVTLIAALTAGCISAERGTLADSILSRGISRYQYFLAKWHARLATVLGTFLVMGVMALVGSLFLFQEDLSFLGSVVALLTVAVMLTVVITCGVTFSAISNSTVMGITVLWIFLYGLGFILSLVPSRFPSPHMALARLPHMLRGHYSMHDLGQLASWAGIFCCVMAVVGLAYFSRRDV